MMDIEQRAQHITASRLMSSVEDPHAHPRAVLPAAEKGGGEGREGAGDGERHREAVRNRHGSLSARAAGSVAGLPYMSALCVCVMCLRYVPALCACVVLCVCLMCLPYVSALYVCLMS